MKRVLFVLLALAMACASLPVTARAGAIELTYSNFFPPTHVQSQLADAWAKEVEKRTDGKVKIAYFPGGTLTNAKQCYDGVVEGLSDIGMSALAYSRGRFPVLAAVDLPLGYPNGVAATKVANAVYEKFMPKEFDDTEVMFFHAHGPGVLCTAKAPVDKLEDLKGLKLRATGNSAKLVEILGGTPVAMSMPDSYQSIQKGVVNGGIYPIETNKGWKMAEVVDYCTQTPAIAYTTTFFVAMNKDKWKSLPADVQKVIREVNTEFAAKHGEAWDAADVLGKEALLAKGGKLVPLPQAETDRWIKTSAPMLDAYAEDVKAKGLDGKAIVDYAQSVLHEK
ncbi:MAG: TRAP transporter substrate-binding protein [Desulfovibrionaceae bacterium]